MDNKYNGWTNYATWRINLEIFDGQGLEDFYGEVSDDAVKDDVIYDTSEILKDQTEEILASHCNNGDTANNLVFDYAMAFINDVNWYEIAESMFTDYMDNLKEN